MSDFKKLDSRSWNALINLPSPEGKLQLEADLKALKVFFKEEVKPRTKRFDSLEEKISYLIENNYYEEEVFSQYTKDFVKKLYKKAYKQKFRFSSYMGAFKFYASYVMTTFDGKEYLETFEDRVVANALYLGRGDEEKATDIMLEIISGRFQPATPTFLNAGKKQRGEMVSCFLLDVQDNMESISRSITNALQLSKRGGGVALNLSNIREMGAPIKKIEGQSSGIIPVMKLLEDSFSYANQLGQRQGAGATYLNAHHPDIMRFLDTKRENADEKIRIKTLSIGIVVPDITFKLAQTNEDMYLFSPYDVERVYGKPFAEISITEKYYEMIENPCIRKSKINARKLFQTIAELQFESGYPYLLFEDTATRGNPNGGRINMSNLCVTGDTQILTDGGYRNVRELYESQEDFDVIVDERARTMDLNNLGTSVQKSTRMFRTAQNAQIFKIEAKGGYSLRATEWHKMYVVRNGNLVKIPLIEMIVGDEILVQAENPLTLTESDEKNTTAIVASIYRDGVEDVYDVTVENGHSVIFNGIATGNCSEILQENSASTFNEDGSYDHIGNDISCNLGSLNIAKAFDSTDFAKTVETAVRALTTVSNISNTKCVPSIEKGNDKSHAIGLGQMNLHGFLAREKIHYDSPETLEFVEKYFYAVLYQVLKASNKIAIERNETYSDFEKSTYASGAFFKKFIDEDWSKFESDKIRELFEKSSVKVPTPLDWVKLRDSVVEHGLYHKYLQAVAPTGSISYINHSTSSIHPVVKPIEIRKEGKLGRIYYAMPYLSDETMPYYKDAYSIGPEAIINVYAKATQFVDQGLSLTLFYPDTATTRDLNKAYIYAFKNGIKTIYYARIRQKALEGTEVATADDVCESCLI